jgi:hypothetical protein
LASVSADVEAVREASNMKRVARQPGKVGAWSFLLVGIVFADVSSAATDFFQSLRPYVELGLGHDTNVFRVNDPAQAGELIDGTDISDSFWRVETGFDSQFAHQRQEFRLRGRIFRNDYDRFDDVDFTGGDAALTWDWAFGNLWDGELGYEFRRALRDFANQVTPHIDVGSSNEISAVVARKFGTHSRLAAHGKLVDTKFSQENRLDLRRATTGLSLAYASRQGNTLSLDADYSTKESQGNANLDYTELVVGPAIYWSLRERSWVRGTLGYAERDQDNPALEDYSGLVGRITGVWAKSEAKSIRMSVWHEISSFGDEIATFALVTGASINPTFQIGNRAYVSFELGYETRDFRGEPDLPGQILPHRDDDVLTGVFRLEWRLTENSNISGEYRTQDRQSTRGGRDYEFNLVQLNFRVGL